MTTNLTLILIAVLVAGCSTGSPRPGGTPTPGGPPVPPQRSADMATLLTFIEENNAPWTAIADKPDGFHITTARGDPDLESRADALLSTPLIFEYPEGVPRTPLPTDPSLIAIPTLERYGNCHILPGLEGTIVAHPDVVLAFRPDEGQQWAGQVIKIYWPVGWSARREGERLALLDAARNVVAYEGDSVGLGGGSQHADGYWACNVYVPQQ